MLASAVHGSSAPISAEVECVRVVELEVHMAIPSQATSGSPMGLLRIVTDQGIEGWSEDVSLEVAHHLKGEAGEVS